MIRQRKRLWAMLLSAALLVTQLPTAAFAAEENGPPCENHPEHTAECGYREAEPGQPCQHEEHTGDCYTDELICGYKVNGGEAGIEGALGGDGEDASTTAEDTTPPTVVSVTPLNGKADVPVAGEIVITFSEAMDPEAGRVVLIPDSGEEVSRTAMSWGDDCTCTISYTGLAYGTKYTIFISGFHDLAVSMMENDKANSFTTEAARTGDTGDFTVTGGTLNTDYSYAGNVLTIKTGTNLTISGTTTKDKIVVESGGTANLTLDGVHIKLSGNYDGSSLDVAGATLHLALKGENSLETADYFAAALHVPEGAKLEITGGESDKLTVTSSGNHGTAIGGSGKDDDGGDGESGGEITINGGEITAKSKNSAIGGGTSRRGNGGDGGTITISGSKVTAISSTGTGIGGGEGYGGGGDSSGGNGGTIKITNSTVNATGVTGIGGGFGSGGGSGGDVTITNSTVNATGTYGAGIGGGYGGDGGGSGGIGGTVTIKGGSVTAESTNGKDIGGGSGIGSGIGIDSGGTLAVSDGAVLTLKNTGTNATTNYKNCTVVDKDGNSTKYGNDGQPILRVNLAAIPGVTAPATGAAPVTAITETEQYKGSVKWSPNPGTAFAADKEYTATITLDAKDGFAFDGVAANFFTVTGATSVTNAADSGVVTAVFPATTADYTVRVTVEGGGTAQAVPASAPAGTEIVLSATPSGGWHFDRWTVTSGTADIQSNRFIMPAKNVEIKAIFARDSGGSHSGGSSGGNVTVITPQPTDKDPNPPAEGVVKPAATVDKDGNVKVTVTDKDVQNAIDKAAAQAKKDGKTQNGVAVSIDLTGLKTEFNTLPLTLSRTAYKKLVDAGVKYLSIKTPQIALSLDLETLKTIYNAATGDVTINAVKTENKELPSALQGRPAYDLTITTDGKTISDFGKGYVSVSLPYTLQTGEQGGNLQMAYIDAAGKVQNMTDSSYDANSKALIGRTNHFTVFGISDKPAPAFTDVEGHWAKDDILFVASRGLLNGTGDKVFSPNGSMTRGMFVMALYRLAGDPQASGEGSAFTDVPADAYYASAVKWASSKGIVSGTTATTFAPDRAVTRQEMALIMTNYAKVMGYTVPRTREAVTFADNASIASWAVDAVKAMQMAGVINGKDTGRFDPTGTATRAEVSAVLHRYVELVIDPATAQGWDRNDSGQWIYYENGQPATGIRTIDGTTYHFDAKGFLTKIDAIAPGTKKYTTYVVQKDDTLWGIAAAHGCTVAEIVSLNSIKDPNLILEGQQLRLPQK